jgi:two-component system, chemotaxis family, sensor kinase CheA
MKQAHRFLEGGGAGVPGVVGVCQAISAETSEAAIYDRSVSLTLELVGASIVRLYLLSPSGELELRASAPTRTPLRLVAEGEPAVTERLLAVLTSQRCTYFDDACVVPVAHDGATRGVLVIEGGLAAKAGEGVVSAITTQIAIAIANAEQYGTLEKLVEQEMTAAVEREQAMQLVLDSMGDGLIVCELDGTITPIRSRSACAWFGVPPDGARLWSYLAGDDLLLAARIELAFQSMAEDVMPFELSATLGPARLPRAGRFYSLGYKQVFASDTFSQIVVSVVDVTEAVALERAERAARELPAMVGHLIRDRAGFTMMLDEVERLLGELGTVDELAVRARIIHTLKGTTSIFGFRWFADSCHALEDELAEDASVFDGRRLEALRMAWRESLQPLGALLDRDQTDHRLHVLRDEYEHLLAELSSECPHEELSSLVRSWLREPMAPAFEGLGLQATRLAGELGKSLRVAVDAPGRLPEVAIAPVLAQLVHAVRNAIDHGIEEPDERIASGKPPESTLSISARSKDDALDIVITDDGRGIDWDRVRAKGVSLGLPTTTERALTELLFHDGLSTRDVVSDVSGRGVGMGSLREAIRAIGGVIDITSERGRGTRVAVSLPIAKPAG